MGARGDNRFPDNMGKVGPNDKIHRKSRCEECRSGEKTASNPEKSPQNSDDKSDGNQVNRIEMNSRDRKIHWLRALSVVG